MTEQEKPPFRLAQIFLIEAAFGHRGNPLLKPADTKVQPQKINVGMQLQHMNDGSASQVIVTVQTNPEDGDPNALYDFHVVMSALVESVDRERFDDKYIIGALTTMVFPFLRELVANLTVRGRFGVVWLNPFNVQKALEKPLEAVAVGDAVEGEDEKEKTPTP